MSRMVGLVVGIVGGLLYYRLVGCWTGTCWMTGTPWGSGAYFGVLGWIAAGGATELSRLTSRQA